MVVQVMAVVRERMMKPTSDAIIAIMVMMVMMVLIATMVMIAMMVMMAMMMKRMTMKPTSLQSR